MATAAAVLGGAWAVGDSVRGSLEDLALARLGRTEYAVVSNQFFREQLAPGAPMIALEAVVTHEPSGRRASRVAVYGVDDRFFEFHQVAQRAPKNQEVLVSPALARELVAHPDDTLLVRMPRVSAIPMESLHGAKDDPGRTIRTRMREVISRAAMGEFSLRPSQGDVRAVFLPLARLQREFEQDRKVNTALLKSALDLKSAYRLEDVGLHLNGRMLQSDSIVFSDPLVAAVKAVDPAAQPVFTYLANVIRVNGREVPYSLIAAIDRPDLPNEASMTVNEWLRSELAAKPGDRAEIQYYLWDPGGRLTTRMASFRISGVVPISPEDQELAPEYPGISGAATMSDWDPPFPIDLKKIRKQDEVYWDKYRATPKAFISLAAGQKLWRSRYGAVTSIRVSPSFDPNKLRDTLDPGVAGLTELHVRRDALAAAGGSTDFSEYFLYFSFFLIISAILLTGLFFRFGFEQRLPEIATLRALGFPEIVLRRLYLMEGLLLSLAGGLLGVLGAIGYAKAILTGLTSFWIDAVGTKDLNLHISPTGALIATTAGDLIGPIVILLSLRDVIKRSVRDTSVAARGRGWMHAIIAFIAGIGMMFAGGSGGFFGAGALFLISGLLLLAWWLRGNPGDLQSVRGLGLRYASYRPGRSTLCVALIASATFLVVSVEAFRRDPSGGLPGWRYYGETSIPVYHDPNSPAGREALNISSPPQAKWLPFRLRPGDDASCLNLYAPRTPRVLGVPESFMIIPDDGAAVDANTLEYVLHKKVGDEIDVGGAHFRIAKTLDDSIFQSEILVSDASFQKAFPEEGGFRAFLVEAPDGADAELETALSDYGLDLTKTADRLASFHRVENTYLSTFQALGGLGLVLGTIGLGAILMRNVLERRRELGLLRAVGYKPADLMRLTFVESAFLLITGVGLGVVCAAIAVMPAILKRGGSMPVWSLLALVAAVVITGMIASLAAVRLMLRSPLLEALRSE